MRASIIVPTYRRPDLLARCLRALLHQDFPPDGYEIIICDDAASEETRTRIAGIADDAADNPRGVPVHYEPVTATQGPAGARNQGWRRAAGAVIAFTDDDTIPAPAWLRAGVEALENHPRRVALWGRIDIPLPPDPTDYEYDAAQLANAGFVTANCFCRRTALEAVGGFDERFRAAWREDSDLYFSLLQRFPDEGAVAYAPEAVVEHPIRPAPWGISVRQQRKAQYNALLYKKHPGYYRRFVQPGPPWRYYATLGALAITGGGVAAAAFWPAFAGAALWSWHTARFCSRRLRHTSRAPRHVAEMIYTSMVIPPLSVFWRLYGAIKFRVLFY